MDIKPTIVGRQAQHKKEHSKIEKTLIENVSKIIGSDKKGIISVIDATHSGYVNGNLREYETPSFAANYDKFYRPTPKPLLKHHDTYSDPMGRIYSSAFVPGSFKMPDGQNATGLIKIAAFVPEGDDANKIQDGRHMNVSTGFRFGAAKCSVCGFDFVAYRKTGKGYGDAKHSKENNAEEICNHQMGRLYEGKMANYKCYVEDFLESSVVNEPADLIAQIMSYHQLGNDSLVNHSFLHDLDFYGKDDLSYVTEPVNYGTGSVTVDKDLMQKQQEELMEQTMKELKASIGVLSDNVQKNTEAMAAFKAAAEKPQGTATSTPSKTDSVNMDEAKIQSMIDASAAKVTESVAKEIKTALDSLKPAPAPEAKPEEKPADSAKPEDLETLKKELAGKDSKIADLEKEIAALKPAPAPDPSASDNKGNKGQESGAKPVVRPRHKPYSL
jgi:hypothetical protein